jgi:transcriptional regulator with XRE-family HTH domain
VPSRRLTFDELDVCRAFGERVRRVRLERGLTQQALAAAVGDSARDERGHPQPLDRAFLVRIEKGQSNPTLVTMSRLALALGVPLASLLDEPEVE